MRYLTDVAQTEYKRLKTLLIEEERWDDSFEAVLAVYAQAHADWIEATEEIAKSGAVVRVGGRIQINHWLSVRDKAKSALLSSASALGFTPQSRNNQNASTGEIPLEEYGGLFDD